MTDQGKPPKSAEEIRSRLESISETANAVHEKGVIDSRTQAERQIVVALFYDHQLSRKFQTELQRNGLFSESAVSGGKLVITVNFPDVKQASKISVDFRREHPDRRPSRRGARFDFLLLGIVLGLVVGIIFATGASNIDAAIGFGSSMVGLGAAVGNLLDRIRNSRNRNGKFAFGLWEFLVAMVTFGIFVFALDCFISLTY